MTAWVSMAASIARNAKIFVWNTKPKNQTASASSG